MEMSDESEMKKSIYLQCGLARDTQSTSKKTVQVLACAYSEAAATDEGGEEGSWRYPIDLEKVGERMVQITGARFRSKGPYNQVLAHLLRLVETTNLVALSEGEVVLTTQGFLWGETLRKADLLQCLFDKRAAQVWTALFVLGLLDNNEDFNPSVTFSKSDVLAHSKLSAPGVSRSLHILRVGRELSTKVGIPEGTVTLDGEAWRYRPIPPLNYDPKADSLTELFADEQPTKVEGACPEQPAEVEVVNPSPDVEHIPNPVIPHYLDNTKTSPNSSLELEEDEVTPEMVASMAPRDLKVQPQFQGVLEREASYLGFTVAQTLAYYLNREWLPDLLAAQQRREIERERFQRERILREIADQKAKMEAYSEVLKCLEDRLVFGEDENNEKDEKDEKDMSLSEISLQLPT